MKNSQEQYAVGDLYEPLGIYASTRKQRRKGLSKIAIENSPPELIFEKCRSIHTFGMKFDLKVIFIDSQARILGIKDVSKNRIVFSPKGTHAIVELPLR